MRWQALVVGVLLLAGCGSSHPPTSPSSSTAASTVPTAAPKVAIDLKADAAGSRDAIASLSEVVADASASSGTGLSYAIDFGDGASASTSTARHVYATANRYTVAVTVTDAQGRKASDVRQIDVRAATGSWFQAGYVERTKRVEVRRLNVDAQNGSTVSGAYRVTGAADRTFSATLVPPRNIRITFDGGASLEGSLPSRWSDEAENWALQAQGDAVDGVRLDFRAITSPPDAPPPDADLRVSFSGDPLPLVSVTPVRLDGTASRGSGLSYFLEFGDGQMVAASQATREVDAPKYEGLNRVSVVARLTVVDRFGRSDTEESPYYVDDLSAGPFVEYWFAPAGGPERLALVLFSRSGRTYAGPIRSTSQSGTISADATLTISGRNDVVVSVPAWGTEYRGTLALGSYLEDGKLILVQSGGALSGTTWTMNRRSSY